MLNKSRIASLFDIRGSTFGVRYHEHKNGKPNDSIRSPEKSIIDLKHKCPFAVRTLLNIPAELVQSYFPRIVKRKARFKPTYAATYFTR